MESNVYNKNNIYVYSDEIVKRFYSLLFWYFYQKQVFQDYLERFTMICVIFTAFVKLQ